MVAGFMKIHSILEKRVFNILNTASKAKASTMQIVFTEFL